MTCVARGRLPRLDAGAAVHARLAVAVLAVVDAARHALVGDRHAAILFREASGCGCPLRYHRGLKFLNSNVCHTRWERFCCIEFRDLCEVEREI